MQCAVICSWMLVLVTSLGKRKDAECEVTVNEVVVGGGIGSSYAFVRFIMQL